MNIEKKTLINIEKIPCYCSIGIDPEEKKMGQQLFVDVIVEVDSTKVSNTDNLSDTVNYVNVYNVIQKVGKSKSFSLVEFFTEELASCILQLPRIISVKVKVHKPHIPYKDFQGNVSVEVERKK